MVIARHFEYGDEDKSQSTRLNPNDLVLIPYANVNGVWTLSDGVLRDIALKCQEEDTFKTVFYEGNIQTVDQFIAMLKSPANVPVFIFRGYVPVGFAWLNGCSGRHAFGHFCFMQTSWGRDAKRAAELILHYWMSFTKEDTVPIFDVILGTVPSFNARAIEFVQKIGFVKVGEIPMMMRNGYTGDRDAAVIFYYSRFDHG